MREALTIEKLLEAPLATTDGFRWYLTPDGKDVAFDNGMPFAEYPGAFWPHVADFNAIIAAACEWQRNKTLQEFEERLLKHLESMALVFSDIEDGKLTKQAALDRLESLMQHTYLEHVEQKHRRLTPQEEKEI